MDSIVLIANFGEGQTSQPAPKRIQPLPDNFLIEGYYEPKGSFICSLEALGFPMVEVSKIITEGYDDIWKQQSQEFDEEISTTCWKDLVGKMFYT